MFSTFRTTAITAVALAVAQFASPARADFIFDLTVGPPPPGVWTGSGSIDFTTASGTSTADVAGFTFHVATGGAGSPQDYALADINTISWSIDSSDNLSLLLSSNLITYFGIYESAVLLTNESGSHADPCVPSSPSVDGSATCFRVPNGVGVTLSHASLTATPITAAVPEPASLTLLAVGLAGLGMVVRLRRG